MQFFYAPLEGLVVSVGAAQHGQDGVLEPVHLAEPRLQGTLVVHARHAPVLLDLQMLWVRMVRGAENAWVEERNDQEM
jgi:hypothetical protein